MKYQFYVKGKKVGRPKTWSQMIDLKFCIKGGAWREATVDFVKGPKEIKEKERAG